jgi:3'-5' exoribonuclease
MDASGEIGGRVWDEADRWLPACTVGTIVRITGQAQSFKGVLQLKIATVTAVPEGEADLAQFVPAAPGNLQAMAVEVVKIAKGVADPYLRELLLAFFQDRKFLPPSRRRRPPRTCITLT